MIGHAGQGKKRLYAWKKMDIRCAYGFSAVGMGGFSFIGLSRLSIFLLLLHFKACFWHCCIYLSLYKPTTLYDPTLGYNQTYFLAHVLYTSSLHECLTNKLPLYKTGEYLAQAFMQRQAYRLGRSARRVELITT